MQVIAGRVTKLPWVLQQQTGIVEEQGMEGELAEITKLPDNLIGKDDREHLEAFGSHTIARGRATRWQWSVDSTGDAFEVFAGGANEQRVATVTRDRQADCFRAFGADGRELAYGDLQHVMGLLDRHLMDRHGELPDAPA